MSVLEQTPHTRSHYRDIFISAIPEHSPMRQTAATVLDPENLRALGHINQEYFLDALIETLRDTGLFLNKKRSRLPTLCLWRVFDPKTDGGEREEHISQRKEPTSTKKVVDAYVEPDRVNLPVYGLDDSDEAETMVVDTQLSPANSMDIADDMITEAEEVDEIDSHTDQSMSEYESEVAPSDTPSDSRGSTKALSRRRALPISHHASPDANVQIQEHHHTVESSTGCTPNATSSTANKVSSQAFNSLPDNDDTLIHAARTFIDALNNNTFPQQGRVEPISIQDLQDMANSNESERVKFVQKHAKVLDDCNVNQMLLAYHQIIATVNLFGIREQWRSLKMPMNQFDALLADSRRINKDIAAVRMILHLVNDYGVNILLLPEHINISKFRYVTLDNFQSMQADLGTKLRHMMIDFQSKIPTIPASMTMIEQFARFAEEKGWLDKESGRGIRFKNT